MGVLGIGVPLSPAPALEQGSCRLRGFRGGGLLGSQGDSWRSPEEGASGRG